MLTLITSAILAGGTYAAESGAAPRVVMDKEVSTECHALAPSETFSVQGPASGRLLVRVDLPKRGKARPLVLTVTLDGKRKPHKLRPKRSKTAAYEGTSRVVPSLALTPIPLAVGAGEHTLVM
ncbi:MAG: hypothetical protein HYZ27_11140, partial [Deltaproteobacteria bacterium]|nr:hypothetical protein [Deltaproteobacteria bacterium]